MKINLKMKNRFLKKVSIYFIGTLSSNVINILLVPLYAYFVLTKDLGEYDYILSIATMVTPIVYLVIWESILKYCINNKEEIIREYIDTAMCFVGIASCISIAFFSTMCLFGINRGILLLIGSIIVLDGLTTFWQFSARALGESKQYVIAGIAGSITVIFIDVLYAITGKLDYVGLAIAHIISQLVVIVVLEKKISLLFKFRVKNIKKKYLKKMILFSAPLVLNTVCMWFYTGGNKIIVRNYIGTAENGLYSFAAKFSVLINFCSTVISMAVIEEAYSYTTLEEYKIKIGKLITIISKAYFSMVALALPAIYVLYSIAFKNTEYYHSSDYVFLLLISALFTALSNNFGSAFQVTDNTRLIFVTTILGAVCSLGSSLLLVKYWKIWGVLFGAVVGPFIMMVSRAVYARRATGLSINWKSNIIIIIVSVISSIILKVYDNILVQLLLFVVTGICVGVIYRKEINSLYERTMCKK